MKFLGYMRLQKLQDVIDPSLTTTNRTATVEADAIEAASASSTSPADDPEKNAVAFAELIQSLEDRSLSLVMRDAYDDGRKALNILKEHYAGKGKPRIISLPSSHHFWNCLLILLQIMLSKVKLLLLSSKMLEKQLVMDYW